ncbi:MAG: CDP-diacylglycerol--glycerol-3-phosphate 3-phosphatidyltransferase [Firmicutes bacterium]|nr:CDP-diacylglycerol--glycerol-3-phosphate 3-phosphatidyltransferase [Bacillota bacterium]
MNLPNKLTLSRILLIPIFLFFILCDSLPVDIQTRRYIAVTIFIVASITDGIDGYIARKYKMVTNFGKFMDPLADKLLVSAAMISMVHLGDIPTWIVIVIISREFIITGFRTIAIEQNIVIAAGFWGKIKTVFQMAMIIVVLTNIDHVFFKFVGEALIYLSLIFTIVSAVDYLVKNKSVLKN